MNTWKIIERDTTGTETAHEVESFEVAIGSVLIKLKTPDDRVIRIEGPDGEKFQRWWIERRYASEKAT